MSSLWTLVELVESISEPRVGGPGSHVLPSSCRLADGEAEGAEPVTLALKTPSCPSCDMLLIGRGFCSWATVDGVGPTLCQGKRELGGDPSLGLTQDRPS